MPIYGIKSYITAILSAHFDMRIKFIHSDKVNRNIYRYKKLDIKTGAVGIFMLLVGKIFTVLPYLLNMKY